MKIGITINGVLRNFANNIKAVTAMMGEYNDYHFKNPYNPKDLLKALNIKAERDLTLDKSLKEYSQLDVLLRTLVQYGFNIFADKKGNEYPTVFEDLSKISNFHDVYLITNESGITMNFTLKYLLDNSVGDSTSYKAVLFSYNEEILKEMDIIITDDPFLLKNYDKCLKIQKYWNKEIKNEKEYKDLKDLINKYFLINE